MTNVPPAERLNVLVTDGTYKHTLGIVRALGRQGHTVGVVAANRLAPALHSRYCHRHTLVANPSADPEKFVDDIVRLLHQWHIHLLIPVGFATINALTHHSDKWQSDDVFCLLPTAESFDRAADKWHMIETARAAGLQVPASCLPDSFEDARSFLTECGDGCVMKFRRESIGKGSQRIRDAKSLRTLLETALGDRLGASFGDIILQEYVPGHGAGYMALALHGKTFREFAHRRRREMPASGGYATAAESVADEQLMDDGRRLLAHLKYNGPAMVEFRIDGERRHFIELNPKFWGSLDLALLSGADFPGDLCRLAVDDTIASRTVPSYTVGQRAWRGDLRRLLQRPADIRFILHDLVSPRARSNWRWTDPIPNFLEIGGELTYGWRHRRDT